MINLNSNPTDVSPHFITIINVTVFRVAGRTEAALHSIFLRVSVLVVVGRARRMLLCQLRDPPLCHRSPAVQRLRNERRSGCLSSNLSPAELFQPVVLSGAVDGGQLLFLFTGSIRRLDATMDLRSRWFPQQHEFICLIQHILRSFLFTNVIVLLTKAASPGLAAAETCPLPRL